MKYFALYPFPFGFLKIGVEDNAVVLLQSQQNQEEGGVTSPLTDEVYAQVMAYLRGERQSFDFPYRLQGTVFQEKVWRALSDIPYGETRTYQDIAKAIGNEKACRAVGLANNKNPLALVIPCHRVIGANGKLVGYAGGLAMKQALLCLEKDKEYSLVHPY